METQQAVAPMVFKTDGDDHELVCPKCGMPNLHIIGVDVHSGDFGCARITNAGVNVNPHLKPRGRGSVTRLRFLCECGNAHDVAFTFVKGTMMVEQEDVTDYSHEGGPVDIWRD